MALLSSASSKGLRMLSFVHDLQVCAWPNSEDDVINLRALCWASYRKSVKYKVKMVVQRNGSRDRFWKNSSQCRETLLQVK